MKTPQEKILSEMASLNLRVECLTKECTSLRSQVERLTTELRASAKREKATISTRQFNDLMMRLAARDLRDSKVETFLRAISSDQRQTEAILRELLASLEK